MVRETWVQSQVASHQKWYLIPPCVTLSNIRYVWRVKKSNPRKEVAPSPTPRCSSYWKASLLVALDYSRQLYLLLNNPRICKREGCSKSNASNLFPWKLGVQWTSLYKASFQLQNTIFPHIHHHCMHYCQIVILNITLIKICISGGKLLFHSNDDANRKCCLLILSFIRNSERHFRFCELIF